MLENNLRQIKVHMFMRTINLYPTLDSLACRHSCEAFLCHSHNRAFAVKKYRGTWKLLDSLKEGPTEINASSTIQPFTAYKLTFINENLREDIAHPTPPYMERQEKDFCLVHSFNMAIGEHVTSGNAVLSHIQHMEETLVHRNLQEFINLNRFYTHGRGNFNIMIFNHFLSKFSWNQDKRYILKYAHTNLAASQITKELVEGALHTAAYKDAVILTTVNDGSQGHAVTLKRKTDCPSRSTSTWYLLDSLKSHPKTLLTSRDWNNLQGSILTFQQGSVWDGLDPASDLHLADSSIPFDAETFVYDKNTIHIDTTPTASVQVNAENGISTQSSHAQSSEAMSNPSCAPTQPFPTHTTNGAAKQPDQ